LSSDTDFVFSKGFAKDEHIPDLLAFTPQVQFQDDPSFMLGKIVLQDKASCFPAAVLAPPARDDCFVIGGLSRLLTHFGAFSLL
jgi:putative methyltransferase